MSIFFLAHPEDESAPEKSIPDYESGGAVWIECAPHSLPRNLLLLTHPRARSADELHRIKLRGNEPLSFFPMVASGKYDLAPLSVLSERSHHDHDQ
jgi:hypothetical protein